MVKKDPNQTDASGLEPSESPTAHRDSHETQDALTRVHENMAPPSRAPQRASERLAAVPRNPPRPSARHNISSHSTRTALPTQSSHRSTLPTQGGNRSSRPLSAASSRRLPATQFLDVGATPSTHTSKRTLLLLAGGIVGPVVLILALIWIMTPNQVSARAAMALDEGGRLLLQAREAIATRRVAEAMRAIDAGRKSLDVPMPDDAALAQKLKEMSAQFQQVTAESQRLERDIAVQQNLDALLARFARLSEWNQTELDTLERQSLAFVANPIKPGADTDPAAVETYKSAVDHIRRNLDTIKLAQKKLEASRIAIQETKARSELTELIRRERFQEALDLLADYRQKYPEGRFDDHQTLVDNAIKRTWDAVKVYAESRIQDARTPGIPAVKRKQVIDQARKRLQEVVTNFGIPAQVDAAKALLQQLPAE